MGYPQPVNTSGTARLMAAPPGYAVGWLERVLIPNPAAGAAFTYVGDGRYVERLISVRFTLATSAVVANRFPVMRLLDATGRIVMGVWAGGTVAASTTLAVNLAREFSLQSNYGGAEVFGPMVDLVTPPGYSWQLVVQNEDVGDQVSTITLLVQRFPTDTAEILAGE